jgi:hypothetical protein
LKKDKEKIRQYGKYPNKKKSYFTFFDKSDETVYWYGYFPKYYRINPLEKYLKPTKRRNKSKGKEYPDYILQIKVPEECKYGVKVIITPYPEGSNIKKIRKIHRDLNELGPEYRKKVEDKVTVLLQEKKYNEAEKIISEWLYKVEKIEEAKVKQKIRERRKKRKNEYYKSSIEEYLKKEEERAEHYDKEPLSDIKEHLEESPAEEMRRIEHEEKSIQEQWERNREKDKNEEA